MHVLIEAFRLFSFYVVIDGAAFRAIAVFNLFPPFLLWIAVCFLRPAFFGLLADFIFILRQFHAAQPVSSLCCSWRRS